MKKTYLSIAVLCISLCLCAQMNTGINTSAWGGVSNTTWNPAISDSKYAFDLSIGGMNSGFIQNYKGISASGLIQNTGFADVKGLALLNLDLFSNPSFAKSQNSDGKLVNLRQFTQIEGPGSFLIPFGNNKNAIAITYHLNAARSIQGMDPRFGFFAEGNPSAAGTGSSNTFAIAAAAWIDYDVTYGRTVLDKGKHFVKVGATIKLLHEIETATAQAGLDGYSFSATSLSVASGTISSTYNYGPAFSAAGDIGAVYEYRPYLDKYRYDIDTSTGILPRYRNLYMLAVGFSVIDMGALPNSSPQTSGTSSLSNATFGPSDFDVLSKAPLGKVTAANPGAYTGAKSIGLPTRFNLYADYNTKVGFGVNVSTTISPVFKSANPQLSYGSNISVTPRFDLPMFGAYLPLSYNFNGNAGVGVALRGGPVWIGVSDVTGLFKSTGMNNGVVYAALKVPIIFHHPKDQDGDKVSDKYDKCPFEKGTWRTQGCTDRDGDGIRDVMDECPDVPGPAYLRGCPDTDGDSIPDREDSCVTVKGPRGTHGCPDIDGDGVIDKYDDCPTDSGSRVYNGCPDTDGDGIPDRMDDCPKLPGEKVHRGCPDSDGDGLFDNEDQCPDEAGPKENHGCPWPDSDGDGITDNLDLCPAVPGLAEYHGCPAPAHVPFGTRMTQLYDSILFEPGKEDLSAANLVRVHILAHKMIVENPSYNVILIGHTDNSEAESSLLYRLSVARAEAVRQALIRQGVAEGRITIDGYGSEQPAGDNTSAIARKFNRRVQMIIELVGGE